jgi:hypothetical protein
VFSKITRVLKKSIKTARYKTPSARVKNHRFRDNPGTENQTPVFIEAWIRICFKTIFHPPEITHLKTLMARGYE